jgi:hypothetical protein
VIREGIGVPRLLIGCSDEVGVEGVERGMVKKGMVKRERGMVKRDGERDKHIR